MAGYLARSFSTKNTNRAAETPRTYISSIAALLMSPFAKLPVILPPYPPGIPIFTSIETELATTETSVPALIEISANHEIII